MTTIRDIAIIVLAVESIIIGIVLITLSWQVYRLVRLLQDEIRPLLQDVDQTVRTVQGTATFLSQNLVSPAIRVSSTVAGVRRAVKVAATLLQRREDTGR